MAPAILIRNGLLLTMNPERHIIPGGSILITEGRILSVNATEPSALPKNTEVIDARGGIVMPGMVNCHTHLGMSFFRSLADDQKDRLRKVLFPLEKAVVDEELVYWASLHSYTEMIQGGVTTLCDMYYFEDAVARAADTAGVRSILGETILNFPSPDSKQAYGGIEYAREFIGKWRDHPTITPAVAPHAPYTLDDEHMKLCYNMARSEGVPFTLHLNEMPFEMEQFQREYGESPIVHLNRLGVMDEKMIAAHCIFTDERDREILKKQGVGVAHNIVANIKGAKGIADIPEMIDMGIPVGLGSDGPMSGNTQDVITLMGYAGKLQKLKHKDPCIMPALTMVEMATISGAEALHMDDEIGSLEPGKKADVVILNHDSPTMFPIYDPYAALVYSASPRDVDTVLVDGRILMRERRIPHVDINEIRTRGLDFYAKVCGLPELDELNLKVWESS